MQVNYDHTTHFSIYDDDDLIKELIMKAKGCTLSPTALVAKNEKTLKLTWLDNLASPNSGTHFWKSFKWSRTINTVLDFSVFH